MKKTQVIGLKAKKKKYPASENQGEKISAASCNIIRKVDKPQNRFVHRQSTGKKFKRLMKVPSLPSHGPDPGGIRTHARPPEEITVALPIELQGQMGEGLRKLRW